MNTNSNFNRWQNINILRFWLTILITYLRVNKKSTKLLQALVDTWTNWYGNSHGWFWDRDIPKFRETRSKLLKLKLYEHYILPPCWKIVWIKWMRKLFLNLIHWTLVIDKMNTCDVRVWKQLLSSTWRR